MRDGHLNKCKVCVRAYVKQWAKDNPDKAKSQHAAWRAANPEKWKEQRASQYAKDKASGKAAEKAKKKNEKRKAQKGAGRVSYKAVLERDGMFCYLCEQPIDHPRKVHYDHVIPLSRGGEHSYENLRVTHAACNSWKHDRLLSELEGLSPAADVPWDERRAEKAAAAKSEAARRFFAGDPEKIAARNAKISAAQMGNQNGAASSGRNSRNARANWPDPTRWAKNFDACLECGTAERPHKSKGKCDPCYLRAYRAALPQDVRRGQVHQHG